MDNGSHQAAGVGFQAAPAAPASPTRAVADGLPVGSGTAGLNLLALPMGVVGLAGAWQAMATSLHAPAWPDEVFTALGILIAQLLAHWLPENLPTATLHPGYFLPTVAGPFVASIGLGLSGWPHAAEGAFGIGVFLWLIIGSLIFNRLFTGAPLPDAVKPSLAVLLSAPATGGVARFIISKGQMTTVEYLLLGVTLLMVAVQILLFPEYRRLTFSPNFWAFTFPASTSTSLIIRWLRARQFPYWHAWCWTITAVTTIFVLAIAAATVADWQNTAEDATAPRPRYPSSSRN